MSAVLSIETNITAWNAAFEEYVRFTSKQPQEALEHKLGNLGKALSRGFRAHQFGGVPKQRGVALSELAVRTGEHRGTTVRPTLLAQYMQLREVLREKAKSIKHSLREFGGTLDNWSALNGALTENREARVNAWQQIVGREVASRQAGIGELGASFLWFRNRGKGDSRTVVPDRYGKIIGSVVVTDGVAIIAGNVDGLTEVDTRYGVVAQAIADETDDTMVYVKRKQDEAAEKLLKTVVG